MENDAAMLTALDAYSRAQTPQARAQIEERLWSLATPDDRAGKERRQWLMDALGQQITGGANQLDCRRALLYAPQLLWDRINTGEMSLRTAVELWRDAKNKPEPEQRLRELIADWAHAPKKKNGYRRAPSKGRVRFDASKSVDGKSSRAAWGRLRKVLAEIVTTKFAKRGHKPTDEELKQVYAFIEAEMETVIAGINARVRAISMQGHESVFVTRRQVLDACRTLSVTPPRPGLPVDIAQARRQKRQLANAYHPDKVGDGLRDHYEAVIAAFSVLELYNKQNALKEDDNGN